MDGKSAVDKRSLRPSKGRKIVKRSSLSKVAEEVYNGRQEGDKEIAEDPKRKAKRKRGGTNSNNLGEGSFDNTVETTIHLNKSTTNDVAVSNIMTSLPSAANSSVIDEKNGRLVDDNDDLIMIPSLYLEEGGELSVVDHNKRRRHKAKWSKDLSRLEGKHFPRMMPDTDRRAVSGRKMDNRQRCKYCARKCSYYCATCDVYLCITSDASSNCFETFHTSLTLH